jgi:methyl-accepting chemotaxis protein
MKHTVMRIVGVALIVAGIAGLFFSIAGIVVLVQVEERIEQTLMQQLDLIEQALAATADGLVLANDLMGQAAGTAGTLENAIDNVGQSVGDTVPIVDSVGQLLGDTLPATIETAQDTLRSISSSAQLVDDILYVVTGLPFLNLEDYNPEVPLSSGFSDVADDLNQIPKTLGSMEQDLATATDNLGVLEQDFANMANDIGRVTNSLESAESVLGEYQDIVADLQVQVASVREKAPQWLRLGQLGISLGLVWLGIAQIGLITQGFELVSRSRQTGDSLGGEPSKE